MIYSIDEISKRVVPIAERFRLSAVYLFGSYARNEATDNSDVDILIDKTGSKVSSLFHMGSLHSELCSQLNKNVDIITTDSLKQTDVQSRTPWFIDNLMKERIILYEGK